MASPAIATAIAEPPSARWRAAIRLVAAGAWLLACLVPHLLTRPFGRSRWPRRFLAGVAAILGAEVRVDGRIGGRPTLLIANHVSWLDIPVLAGATGCVFVSKAEVRDHRFLKWIADQNATIYIDRGDRRAIHGQAAAIRAALGTGQPVALFPEGTVGDGGRLLAFKPALLSAVSPPPEGAQLVPVAIDYGLAGGRVLRWTPEEGGIGNFLRIVGRKGRLAVTVRLLAPLAPTADRKALALAAHDSIAAALAPSGIAPAAL